MYLDKKDVRPSFGHANGDGLADAPRGAGDEHRLALKGEETVAGHGSEPWVQFGQQFLGNVSRVRVNNCRPGGCGCRARYGAVRQVAVGWSDKPYWDQAVPSDFLGAVSALLSWDSSP